MPKPKLGFKYIGRYGFHIVFVLLIANIGMVIAIRLYILAQLPCMTIQEVQSDSRCLYILNDKVYEKGNRNNPHQGNACGSDVTAIIATQPFHIAEPAKYLDPNIKGQICAANPSPSPTPPPAPDPTPSPTPVATASPQLSPTPSAQINPTPSSNGQTQYPTPTPNPSSRANTQPTATPGIGGFINPTPQPTAPSKPLSKTNPKATPYPTPQKFTGASAYPSDSPESAFLVQAPVISPAANPLSSPATADITKGWTEAAISWTQAAIYVALSVLAFTATVGAGRYFQHKKEKPAKNS